MIWRRRPSSKPTVTWPPTAGTPRSQPGLPASPANRWRSHRRHRHETAEWTGDAAPADAAAGYETTTPAGTAAADLRHDLNLAIARLSDDEQAAILLCFNRGLTHERPRKPSAARSGP